MSYHLRSLAQNPSDSNYGTSTEKYEGPASGGTSYQSEYRTSAQHATAFQTSHLSPNKPLSISAQTRRGVFQWDTGATNPGFNQNQ